MTLKVLNKHLSELPRTFTETPMVRYKRQITELSETVCRIRDGFMDVGQLRYIKREKYPIVE